MNPAIVRIILRVAVGFLIGKALLTPEDGNMIVNDPDTAMLVELALSSGMWAATELWYWAAKKFGWRT